MSPKSAQQFWDDDMHENKDSNRVVRVRLDTTRLMS